MGTTGLMRLNHPWWLELLLTQDPQEGLSLPSLPGDHLEEKERFLRVWAGPVLFGHCVPVPSLTQHKI